MDSNRKIQLKDVPEQYFDPVKWDEFLRGHKSREDALERLSLPEPPISAFYRLENAKTNTPEPYASFNRQEKRLFELKELLIEEFKARLSGEKLAATGLRPPSTARNPIPAELWAELTIDFRDSSAASKHYQFTGIVICEPDNHTNPTLDLIQRFAGWLRDRGQINGRELKKTLSNEAKKQFGRDFS